MYKKVFWIFLLVIGVLIMIFMFILLFGETPIVFPDRAAGIPETAVWHGGSDGGDWIDLHEEVSENLFLISIYHENGNLLYSGLFEHSGSAMSIDELKGEISSWTGIRIILRNGDSLRKI